MQLSWDSPYIWLAVIIAFILWKKWSAKKMEPLIKEYLNNGATVIDVRTPEEYQGGHCQGSINVPLNVIEARYLEFDKNKPIVVCCASGGRSGMALTFFKSKGYEKVINAGAWTNVKKMVC